jgi:hypothetical protein
MEAGTKSTDGFWNASEVLKDEEEQFGRGVGVGGAGKEANPQLG